MRRPAPVQAAAFTTAVLLGAVSAWAVPPGPPARASGLWRPLLAMVLLVAHPAGPAGGLPPGPLPLPPDPGGEDPDLALAAREVSRVLDWANASATIPLLGNFDGFLLAAGLFPEPGPLPWEPQQPQALLAAPGNGSITPALGVLDTARWKVASFVLEGAGEQLLTDLSLLPPAPELFQSLGFAGNELVASSFLAGATANQPILDTAREKVAALLARQATAPAPAPSPAAIDGFISPDSLYGTWQSVTGIIPGQWITYRIAVDEVIKTITILDGRGQLNTHTDSYPGSVLVLMAYTQSQGAVSAGGAQVTVRIEDAHGDTQSFPFTFFRGTDWTFTERMDVLVDQGGNRETLVRVEDPRQP